MQSSTSGLNPYASPSHLIDISFDADALIEGEVALEVDSMLEGWDGKRKSPRSDWSLLSLTAWRGSARSAEQMQASSGHIDVENIVALLLRLASSLDEAKSMTKSVQQRSATEVKIWGHASFAPSDKRIHRRLRKRRRNSRQGC